MATVMKRHEWFRQCYRQKRDLDHLSAEELSERLHDCINNMRTRTERGKLGLLSPGEPLGENWMILFTEILEECTLRGYAYPGPITIAKYRSSFEHVFDPIPDIEQVIDQYGLRSKPYLLKFGAARWLGPSLEKGKFRIASASYYDSANHNHARRDTELQRFIRPNPKNSKFVESSGHWISIASPTDYLLFSMSAAYSARLFGDFAATACLVIFDPKTLVNRFTDAVTRQLSGWHIGFTPVTYYDPVRVDPDLIVVSKFKPFRHAYQREVRLVCVPSRPVARLSSVEIEIGPLSDCATLVDISTHPPSEIPHDPKDDPIQVFGNINQEHSMVHHLPDAARIQGLLLNKSAPRHEDWYFQIQYSDDNDVWHEIKMPMLDGLYLLNLLRAAEKEQHLGLWNRE
jgi:hypothetical protein